MQLVAPRFEVWGKSLSFGASENSTVVWGPIEIQNLSNHCDLGDHLVYGGVTRMWVAPALLEKACWWMMLVYELTEVWGFPVLWVLEWDATRRLVAEA